MSSVNAFIIGATFGLLVVTFSYVAIVKNSLKEAQQAVEQVRIEVKKLQYMKDYKFYREHGQEK